MRKNGYPKSRGDALTSKIDTYRRDHAARKRAAFVDRGLDGIVAGYSDAEFLRLQCCLLDRSQTPSLEDCTMLVDNWVHRGRDAPTTAIRVLKDGASQPIILRDLRVTVLPHIRLFRLFSLWH
jgi:hypothetical protein